MNRQEREAYLERYGEAKKKGVSFFPDILFKDAVISLLVFIVLVALAYFVGSPLEERADPADTTYTPRPEWYFLFLFQLLKYFPGELEVVGVVVLPTLVIILLFLLPFLDRSPKRHYRSRPTIPFVTVLFGVGIIFLTIQSVQEAPPPVEAAAGDEIAALYTNNCAGCHGPTLEVPLGSNLHNIIAQGSHDGMPAWTADLTTDEIDALAGFILSPLGSELFTRYCSECHEAATLVAGDQQVLREVLDQGPAYPAHAEIEIPEWIEVMSREERTSLLNFLVAPDGQRLFAVNCSPCHGRAVSFNGEEEELRHLISEGGKHLEMPAWQNKLTPDELDRLALYVVKPSEAPSAAELFEQRCARCHGDRIPAAPDFAEAREIIATGGSHETMPVWGEVLTTEQLGALVEYTLASSSGTSLEAGQLIYLENCASCHGDFGEGGENPGRTGDVIAPISTAEYLKTRDNATIRAVISQGQPNFGMSPFATTFGGPLDEDQIDALVAFIRSWEADPPVELPPDIPSNIVALSGVELYLEICAQCHGFSGGGETAPSLRAHEFRTSSTSQDIFDTIERGHEATDMIAWGAILSSEQILELVGYIEALPIDDPTPVPTAEATAVNEGTAEPAAEEPTATPEPTAAPENSFAAFVVPILEARCIDCHESNGDGGWDARTYESVMNTGDNAPVVIPGDAENSLLAQKLLGTHEEGDIMPPPSVRPLNEDLIQIIIDWINAGAPNN